MYTEILKSICICVLKYHKINLILQAVMPTLVKMSLKLGFGGGGSHINTL